MGAVRQLYLAPISWLAWKIPGWPKRLMHSFHFTEKGSAYDMLAACAATDRPDLRRKYFRHALDEARHSDLFRERVEQMGGLSPRLRALEAGGSSSMLDVVEGETLFERLGELEFLSFVYIAEEEAVEQFHVYQKLGLMDDTTDAMMKRILKDEAFHVSYSRAELERYRREGRGDEVKKAMRRVWRRRLGERWLIFGNSIGDVVTGVMLTLLYLVGLAPGRLLTRLSKGGLQAPVKDPRPLAQLARSQG
jgi:bacterioferritin (cytochrome b1)